MTAHAASTVLIADNAPRAPSNGQEPLQTRQKLAVVGSGISGLSASWLLSQGHDVTLFESHHRLGGHAHTVDVSVAGAAVAVDTGFIVYNEPAYSNLTALFDHLGVRTHASDMSFAVSLDGGRLEYSSGGIGGLLAQPANALSPRFWRMLAELRRFYREAPADARNFGQLALDDYLGARGYSDAFRQDHLYPMAAAIWSAPVERIGRYPTEAFVRFCENHRLLELGDRPAWRTVVGGSRQYVNAMTATLDERQVLRGQAVCELARTPDGVRVRTAQGWHPQRFDAVVIATHADEALGLLDAPSSDERRLLGAFSYSRNLAVLHTDTRLMPSRRRAWSSWNYLGQRNDPSRLCVSYWMNRLQPLGTQAPVLLTLNPTHEPSPGRLLHTQTYEHPLFDSRALRAQGELWRLQGQRRTWFCGAYFGSGFHEDGLQAGLAVAESLGGVRRPWRVANESGRIPAMHAPAGAGSP